MLPNHRHNLLDSVDSRSVIPYFEADFQRFRASTSVSHLTFGRFRASCRPNFPPQIPFLTRICEVEHCFFANARL